MPRREESRGGLKLNARDLVLRGGDSEIPTRSFPAKLEHKRTDRPRSQQGRRLCACLPLATNSARNKCATLEEWIQTGAAWPAPPIDPAGSCLVAAHRWRSTSCAASTLDTLGDSSHGRMRSRLFLADKSSNKRNRIIDRTTGSTIAPRTIESATGSTPLPKTPHSSTASLNSTGPLPILPARIAPRQ